MADLEINLKPRTVGIWSKVEVPIKVALAPVFLASVLYCLIVEMKTLDNLSKYREASDQSKNINNSFEVREACRSYALKEEPRTHFQNNLNIFTSPPEKPYKLVYHAELRDK